MKVPMFVATAVAAALTACAGPASQSNSQPPRSPAAAAVPSSPAPAIVAAPGTAAAPTVAECVSSSEPPVPSPRTAADVPGALQTNVTIVGTVCSAESGEPISGARVSAEPVETFCAEGHQPWRCSYTEVTDDMGHYGLTLFEGAGFHVTVEEAGYQAGGGVVMVAQPGIQKVNWTLAPVR